MKDVQSHSGSRGVADTQSDVCATKDKMFVNHADAPRMTVQNNQTTRTDSSACGKLIRMYLSNPKRGDTCSVSFSNEVCYKAGGPVNALHLMREDYNAFRVSTYWPDDKFVPWKTRNCDETMGPITMWQKTVRPTKSDYKEFRDDANWNTYREHFLDTLTAHCLDYLIVAHCLDHLIDPNHKPKNDIVFGKQCNCINTVFGDNFKAPVARTIVLKHQEDKDIPALWKELCLRI